jgi:hypothetical protein
MNPLAFKISAMVALAALVGGLVAGFTAGWAANGWRLAGKVAELHGVVDTQAQGIALLEASNVRCAAGVAEVRAAVRDFAAAGEARAKAAQAAMEQVARRAAALHAAAKGALERPAPKPGEECAQAALEATDYARRRRQP